MSNSKLFRVIELVVLTCFLVVALLLLVLDKRVSYIYQNGSALSNVVFLLIAVITLGSVLLFAKHNTKPTKQITLRTILIMNFVLLFFQILVSWQIFFKTGWDCKELTEMARSIAFQNGSIGDSLYFSMYPNNVFLVGVFSGILKFTSLIGFNSDYFPLIVVGCVLVNASGFFMTDIVRRLTQNRFLSMGVWVVFAILSGLSPWISIPYSDTYSIIFPVLLIWLYVVKTDKNRVPVWILMGFVGMMGYYVKPTAIFALVGICFVEVVRFFTVVRADKSVKKRTAICALGLVLGALLMIFANLGIKSTLKCELDDNKKFTPVHYFMMGLNYATCGTYDQWDVNYSLGPETVAARNEQDIGQIRYRISSLGAKGLAAHAVRKTLTVFNDGSFSWGREGEFYWNYQERNNPLAAGLREYFYEEGKAYWLFQTINQGIWITVILCCLLNLLKKKEDAEENDNNCYIKSAIFLSVLAICLFELLFEARARYLYLYSPLFYIIGILGLEKLKRYFHQ